MSVTVQFLCLNCVTSFGRYQTFWYDDNSRVVGARCNAVLTKLVSA